MREAPIVYHAAAMHTSVNPATDTRRAAGVLLHPTSLPGGYGVGELGDEVIAFLDWAQSAGMRIWQVLPLNPPGYGASPYGCLSSFAGNPLLISPQRLLQDGLLEGEDVADVPRFSDEHVEFERVTAYKFGAAAHVMATLPATRGRRAARSVRRRSSQRPSSTNGWTTTRSSWR